MPGPRAAGLTEPMPEVRCINHIGPSKPAVLEPPKSRARRRGLRLPSYQLRSFGPGDLLHGRMLRQGQLGMEAVPRKASVTSEGGYMNPR